MHMFNDKLYSNVLYLIKRQWTTPYTYCNNYLKYDPLSFLTTSNLEQEQGNLFEMPNEVFWKTLMFFIKFDDIKKLLDDLHISQTCL